VLKNQERTKTGRASPEAKPKTVFNVLNADVYLIQLNALIQKNIYSLIMKRCKKQANTSLSHDFSGNVNSFKTNEDFCKWLISRDHRGHTAIAHYSKGYDSYFILKYCVENGIKPFCVYNGSKIMLMEIKSINLRIIVSSNLNFKKLP
jgi:hypothetical protein